MIRDVEEKRAELAELCRHYRVKRLELFGSAVSGEFNPETSDLDFIVDFQPVPPGEYAKTFFGLHEALENLFHRSVDLLEGPAIRNPYFLAAIQHLRVQLYAA